MCQHWSTDQHLETLNLTHLSASREKKKILKLLQIEGNQIKIEMQSGFSQGPGFMAQVRNGAWHCTPRVG